MHRLAIFSIGECSCMSSRWARSPSSVTILDSATANLGSADGIATSVWTGSSSSAPMAASELLQPANLELFC